MIRSFSALGRAAGALAVLAVVSAEPAVAQQAPAEPKGADSGDQPQAPEVSAEDGQQSLEQAYKREFAFLEAQKQSLEKRLEAFKGRAKSERKDLEGQIQTLKDKAVRLKTRMENVREQVGQAEERLQGNKSNQNVLEATFSQAGVTLGDFGFNLGKGSEFAALAPKAKVERLFDMGNQALEQSASVRRTAGKFYRRDGTEVAGTIVKVGEVAAYGVSDEASGILVPAGGGALKLWQEPHPETAEKVAQGEPPATMPIFLYDDLNQEVTIQGEDSVLTTVQKGGMIGWIIVALGGVAALLALLRLGFLQWASASTARIIDQVGERVSKGEVAEAQALCDRKGGAAWRVVGAAVRNLKRDREHLEDIISEAILRESARLDRFSSLIMVIAAVSPLIGLLGTVTGMIATFEVITEHGTGDPKLLSGGISVALVTTQLGLIVAVPTLLIGSILSGWSERIKNDMEKAALRITNLYTGSD